MVSKLGQASCEIIFILNAIYNAMLCYILIIYKSLCFSKGNSIIYFEPINNSNCVETGLF